MHDCSPEYSRGHGGHGRNNWYPCAAGIDRMTIDVAAVPDEVIERVVAKYVRRWSCDGCGHEAYRITDNTSGTGRPCPHCEERMIVEIDPSVAPDQPSL